MYVRFTMLKNCKFCDTSFEAKGNQATCVACKVAFARGRKYRRAIPEPSKWRDDNGHIIADMEHRLQVQEENTPFWLFPKANNIEAENCPNGFIHKAFDGADNCCTV